jgi:hypothetical protein
LKERIRSDIGHLSNEEAGTFCCYLIDSGTRKIMLGFSKQNNTPLAALQTVKKTTQAIICGAVKTICCMCALRDQISDSIDNIICNQGQNCLKQEVRAVTIPRTVFSLKELINGTIFL